MSDKSIQAPDDKPPPTWESEIKHFFTQMDVGCMRRAGSRFDLAKYEDVKRKAPAIYYRVNLPVDDGLRMPQHARRWSDTKIARFKLWMDNKCPENGEEGSDVA